MSVRVSTSRPLSSACSGLMYSGVPTIWAKPVNSVLSVSRWPAALATPKSITFGTGSPSCSVDQDVGRLEVAVDDALLVGVLHRLADRHEQLQPLAAAVRWFWSQNSVIGTPWTSSMTKYGRPASVAPASSTLAMFGWSIEGQGLPLGLEPGDHLPACPCPA